MCCIISAIGRDAHMNIYETHNEVISILCLLWNYFDSKLMNSLPKQAILILSLWIWHRALASADTPSCTRHHGPATLGGSSSRTQHRATHQRGPASAHRHRGPTTLENSTSRTHLVRGLASSCTCRADPFFCFKLIATPEKAKCYSSMSQLLFTFAARDTRGAAPCKLTPYIIHSEHLTPHTQKPE
jgi:hypothetical protein